MKYMTLKTTVISSLVLISVLSSWQSRIHASTAVYTQQADVRHALVNEIIKASATVVQKRKNGATELASYWTDAAGNSSLESIKENEISLMSLNEKETFIRSLPITVKEHIFNELGEMLLNSSRPRPFNVSFNNLCQWDVFVLITCILLEDEPQLTPLVTALNSCFGLKEIWKIQGRLNKPELCALIPQSFQKRLFATSIQQMMAIKNRISNLINSR